MDTNRKGAALATIIDQGVLPLYFHPDSEVSSEVLRALYGAGIRAVEYTSRGPEALKNFEEMLRLRDAEMPGMLLGVGTIKTAQQALEYVRAGADYLISPGTLPEVAAVAASHGLLWVPGCMTPTEVITAEQLGCGFVKLFPGNLLGPSFVSAIRDLFPEMKFMPTGGVELEEGNLRSWFGAGVSAVGMGSRLISKTLLDRKDYAAIGKLTEEALRLVAAARA